MKKMLQQSLFAVVALALVLVLTPASVKAADNTSAATAQVIKAGETVTGYAGNNEGTYVYYKYVAEKNGYVSFTLKKGDPFSTRQEKWSCDIYDADLLKVNTSSYLAEMTSSRKIVEKGTVYYICVSGTYADEMFSLTANFTPYDSVEKANKDSIQNPTKLKKDAVTLATLELGDYTDYFSYTATKNGFVYFDFSRFDYLNSDTYRWDYYVYNSKMTELASGSFSTEESTFPFLMQKNETIYVKVTNNNYAGNQLYTIKANFVGKNYVEKEDNGSFTKANSLKLGKPMWAIRSNNDADYFKFKASKTATYKITLSMEDGATGNTGYRLTVYSPKKVAVKTVNHVMDTKTIKVKMTKGKTYYMMVSNDGSENLLYNIKISK